MATAAELARFVTAFVLVVAAVAKLLAAAEFRDTLARTQLIRQQLVRPLAAVIPLLELGTGLALVVWPVVGAAAAILILATFSAAAEIVHHRGKVVRCNCFAGVADGVLGRQTTLRNLVLIAIAGLVFARPPHLTSATLPLGIAGVAVAATFLLVISTFPQARRSRAALLEVGMERTRSAEERRRRAA
jgi:hypothetical protein